MGEDSEGDGLGARPQYDASGTAYLCDFAYPDVFDATQETGDPVSVLMFRATFDRHDPAVVFRLQVQFPDERAGKREEEIATEDSTVGTIEFGDGKAHVDHQSEIDGPFGAAQYIVRRPYETDDAEFRYFAHLFTGNVGLASGEDDGPSEECEDAVADVMEEVVTAVTPNPETKFGSTPVEPKDDR